MYHRGCEVSSRLEDLRDLARMRDEGKISPREYDIVKNELLQAPAEEWDDDPEQATGDTAVTESVNEEGEGEEKGWRAHLQALPATYRAALVGAVVVLVAGSFVISRNDAAGTVTALASRKPVSTQAPPPESLRVDLASVAEKWNEVDEPPSISGGITTAPEPGPLDSLLYRFNDSALIAGAYDPKDGYLYALLVRANLHYEPTSTLYIHVCHLLHPGSSNCLETFIEKTGTFGRSHQELIGGIEPVTWEFEGNIWSFEVAGEVETMRVQAPGTG